MNEHNIGFLAVCDPRRHVVGTLTDRDIAQRVCMDDQKGSNIKAAEVMTRDVLACRPDDELQAAEQIMGKHQKSRLLITEKDGTLAGVISLSDVVARHEPQSPGRTLRAVNRPDAHRT